MKKNKSNEIVLNLKGKQLSKKNNIFANIQSFLSIVEIDLSDNNLAILPADLSKFKSAQILNLANNPFKDYKEIVLILQSLPHLIELHIDLANQSDAEFLLSSLPKLKTLNGINTQEEPDIAEGIDLKEEVMDNYSLNNEMKRFNSIIQRTSSIQGFSTFEADLHEKIQDQIDIINEDIEVPNYYYAINILKAKINLYNFIQSKLASMIPCINNKEDTKEISSIMLKVVDYASEHQNEIVDIVFQLHPRFENKINSLLENKALNEQNKRIENNKKETNVNINSTSNIKTTSNPTNSQNQNIMKTSLSTKNLLPQNTNIKREDNKNIFPHPHSNKLNKSSSSLKIVKSSACIISHQLSIKQLLNLINEIYASKSNHDQKCNDNRIAKETLEQHMYTFLTKKYGLKNITIEMASSIINGIRQFSRMNSEVCLFGKILRNELEEESHQVFLKLKQTLIELLNYYYQLKYPYKSHGLIEKIISEKQQSFLNQDEWQNMLKYLFPSDYDIIKDKVIEYIAKQNEMNPKYINQNYPKVESFMKQLSREEIKVYNNKKIGFNLFYNDFTMILLDFQIRLRDKYLFNFLNVFKAVDSNNDGILNENEFKELIIKLNIFTNENTDSSFENLIVLVDPFNTKKITFSDCVSVLSNEKLDDEMSLMDKIALNNTDVTSSNVHIE